MRILFEKLLLILLQCFPNVSNMQTADSVRGDMCAVKDCRNHFLLLLLVGVVVLLLLLLEGGHVCRKIAETTSEPGCDEQNHGVPTHGLPRVKMIISNWCWLCKPDGDGEGSGAAGADDDVAGDGCWYWRL